MDRRFAIPFTILLAAGAMVPATAQTSGRSASIRTNSSARIEAPAMISSSQDLMFVVSSQTMGSIATPVAGISTSAVSTVVTPSTSTSTSSTTTATKTATPTTTTLAQQMISSGPALTVPTQATFMVAGDAGQAISVTVPSDVDLTRQGGSETALLTTDASLADGPQFLGGTFASSGTMSFNVGGQVTFASAEVAAGTYNGVLAVVAQYN